MSNFKECILDQDRSRSILSEEDMSSLLLGSRRLETTVLRIFSKCGWNALRRIAFSRMFVFGVCIVEVLSAFHLFQRVLCWLVNVLVS
jgi:hypothetical protein